MARPKGICHYLAVMIILTLAQAANAQLSLSYSIDGVDPGKRFGEAVAYLGVATDSLIRTFAVGGFYAADSAYGWVRFYAVESGTLIESHSGGYNTHTDIDAFGSVLGGGKDFDGNGAGDCIIASYYGWGCGVSPRNAGDVSVIRGEALWNNWNCFGGDANGQEVGSAVDMIDDVNGDGLADIIAGGRSHNGTGVKRGNVYVYSPPLDSAHLLLNPLAGVIRQYGGPVDNGMLGWSIAALGDVSGDGIPDMIAGAPGDVSPAVAGTVYLLSGAAIGYTWSKTPSGPGTRFGYSVANAGDLDADSKDDVVVGEPASGIGGTDSGRIWAYSGAGGALLWDTPGPNAGDSLGTSLMGIGDIDGDLVPDIAAGAAGGAGGKGRVYLLSGADGSVIGQLDGENVGDQFGYAMTSGDFNVDGTKDLIVSAPGYGSNDGRVYVYLAGVAPPTIGLPLTVYAFSPVDLVVTDLVGDSIGIGFNTIGAGSDYDTLTDLNSSTLSGPDGDPDDIVSIPAPYSGAYAIRIVPEPGADDSARFTLSIRINGNQLLTPDGYYDQPVSALGSTISDTYVYTTAATVAGDVNANGSITSADIIYMVTYVFKGGPAPVVPNHGDVNCDGNDTSADIIYLVGFVFKGGSPPCSQTGS